MTGYMLVFDRFEKIDGACYRNRLHITFETII
jgi:hypothetical protein